LFTAINKERVNVDEQGSYIVLGPAAKAASISVSSVAVSKNNFRPSASAAALRFRNAQSYKIAHYHWRQYIMKNGNKRRAWTAADIRELKSGARKKTTVGKIAKALKRSEGATRQKAFSLGLSLDSRN